MDPQSSAKRNRPASVRRHLKTNSPTGRRRHTQHPTGGGASGRQRVEHHAKQGGRGQPGEPSQPGADQSRWPELRDGIRQRVTSGALATFGAVSAAADKARRSSRLKSFRPFSGQERDPLTRPSTWIVEPSWYERFHNWLADVVPFGWRERARHYGFWRRRIMPALAIIACLALALGVGLFALKAAGHAAGAITSGVANQATPGGAVMISPLNGPDVSPTPTAPQYTVGVWVSNTLPQGGTVTVFIRVSNNTLAQPNARVYLNAQTPNGPISIGPLTTNSYGVASTPLNYGNVGSQQPIFLTATTSIGGQTVSGQYTFVTY